ncbi:hypothetical protein ACF07T_39850 [Streptomyces sp. NPDC015184]|uniref:hypothetical protein n=1 Tax=Streptomyces sp. NPDC015184 TaxID=3364946 RepID=UPI0036F59ECD
MSIMTCETSLAPTPASSTGTCPKCTNTFETCRCTGVAVQAQVLLAPRAGRIDEIDREDGSSGHDGSGYERDETDNFHQLVGRLVDDGDKRALMAGRCARRTYADMVPGPYDRQPVLRMTRTRIEFSEVSQ